MQKGYNGYAMYKYKDKIRYSLVDKSGTVPPYEILNLFQNCSTEQSETIGKGVSYMLGLNKAWVLIGYKLVIERPVKYEEDIIVGTEPTGFRGFFGQRKYCIMDKDENYIIKADSLWTIIDLDSRSPLRITEEDFLGYELGEAFEGIKVERKIVFESEGEEQKAKIVPKSFIDNNGHMNNANYLRLAYEYVDDFDKATEISIAFVKEAVEGQKIVPYIHKEADGVGITFKNIDGEDLAKVLVKIDKK